MQAAHLAKTTFFEANVLKRYRFRAFRLLKAGFFAMDFGLFACRKANF